MHSFASTMFAGALTLSAIGASAQTVVFSPDADARVRTVIRGGPAVSIREPVTVGATLPGSVELQTLPADVDVAYRPYRYVSWDNRVVLVEPGTRRVVRIIE